MGLDSAVLREHCGEIVSTWQMRPRRPVVTDIRQRSFLAINRSFCESLHLKVFGESLTASEPMEMQDPSIEVDRDDTSVHSFNSGTLGERSRGSFSRAPSVTSMSSSTRMERTISADPTTGQSLERTGTMAEGRNNGKPSIHKTASGNSLSRTTSSTGSSHLFRNRQVGFSRTNSSLLTANSSGPVSIFMGKRKTMVVPLGNRLPATRKVSGGKSVDSQRLAKEALMVRLF